MRVSGYKTCLDTKPVFHQDRFCIFYQILRLKLRYGLLNPNPDSHTLPLRQSKYLFKMKGRFSADAKPVWVRQVERRHKAGFGAVGLGSAQSRFWSRHKAGFGAVGLGSAQSRFWSRHKAGFGAAGYKTGFVSRQVLHLLSKLQNWICSKTGQ